MSVSTTAAQSHSFLRPRGKAEIVAGKLTPRRGVPGSIPRPEYVDRPAPAPYRGPEVKDAETIALMREAGAIAAGALAAAGAAVAPGVTTDELDRIAHAYMCDRGAYPSTLGYRSFPKSLCSSVNEVICHGIPDSTVLAAGDIVNLDVTAFFKGVHGDTNATFPVGAVAPEVEQLIERTHEAMMRGIRAARPGRAVNVVGRVVEKYAARFGYESVRDFTGHGIGTGFHTGLVIPHYDSAPQHADVIEEGMTFTVEPMLTLGSQDWEMWDDDWTVVTKDRSFTAQFEHTFLITSDGFEILTLPPETGSATTRS